MIIIENTSPVNICLYKFKILKELYNFFLKAGVGPDGMTISRDGHLWVAVPGDGTVHGALICYDPDTGTEITRASSLAPISVSQSGYG